MKKHQYILLGILFLIISSCEKEATIDVPDVDPKLMVTSFISPQDTIIRVSLSKTKPIFKKSQSISGPISDATVKLSDGERTVTLEYDASFHYYSINVEEFPIVADRVYKLSISTPDGYQAEGICKVPLQNNTLSVDYVKNDEVYNTEYTINLNWNSTAQDNYGFRIYGEAEIKIYNDWINEVNYQTLYFDNQNLIPAKHNQYTRTGTFFYSEYSENTSNRFFISLLNVDEHYYRYHESLMNDQGDNPFTEPALTYSNIKGGLGVFCAYNKSTVIKEF